MRKEAVNTFNEGLIMDLNPLTTPSNVMTSCLNGTIITYNGNEFVLQNDMGNGRVETAYLPAGYVPVGIKEHGGIVYVASYNPLTNKGLIGSFPSPERNISSNEISQSVKTIIPSDFESGGAFSTTYKLNLFEGAEDLVLRSGDKFSIVISGENGPSDLKKYISNYLNTEDDKVISPKNKALTLKACIIDANNNLRDITPQLKRIDVEGSSYDVIEFDDSTLLIFKENSGFYALPSLFEESMDLDEYRKNRALNVYNNKVFGELYIVATLNTIQRIDFSITGSREDDKADLQLMITYYYNCPDGFYDYTKKEDRYSLDLYDRYLTIYGRSSDTFHSNLIKGYKFSIEKVDDVTVPFSIEKVDDVTYLEEENLYKVTNTYDLTGIPITDTDGSDIRSYSVVPAMTYAELLGLTVSGTINLAKLGSGEISLNNWRYFCTQDIITLTWGFEAYLKDGQIIEDLQFEFYNAETQQKDYVYSPTRKYSYNGSFTDVIGYSNSDEGILEYGKLYLVIIKCTLNTKDDSGEQEVRTFARWLLTTSLYNEQYFKTSDYFNFTDEQLHTSDFTGLNDIDFDIDYELREISNEPSTSIQPYSPDLLSLSDLILMGYRTNSKQLQISQTLKYLHLEKYPFELPTGRYTSNYEIDQNRSSLQWEGIVGGNGEIPESVDTETLSTSQSDWATESFDVKQNVLVAQVVNQNRIMIRYKALSFILGKKYQNQKQLVYTKVLSKYGDRMEQILGGLIQSNTTPPFAVQLIFRERLRSGHRDYHGYGYFPIQMDGNWKLLRTESSYANYVTRRVTDSTVTYYASSDWSTFLAEGIKSVLGSNPPIIFMTFNTCTTDAGDYFKPGQGLMKKGTANIKSLALWFNGTDYGMVMGYSTSLSGSSSMLGTIQSHLNQLYIRQAEESVKQGYLVDPESSSYVRGGQCRITTTINARLLTNSSVSKLPAYLMSLPNTVNTIVNGLVGSDIVENLTRLMTFLVNEEAQLLIPIQFDDLLTDMLPAFGEIRLISDSPIINNPVIIDGDTVYQQDSNGFAINEFQIYTKEGNLMKAANTVSGFPRDYANAMVVKTINSDEYHLVPKNFTPGSPKIDARSNGSGDSNSILDFGGIKMVNLKIGSTLMS